MQDEATATSAAQSANSSLFEASRGRKRKRTAEGRTKPFEKPSLHAVECLPGHLVQSVLRAGGRLEDWLSLLPKARPSARTALAVAAAVQHNSLDMHPIDDSMCGDVLAAVKCLATPLHSLKIVSCTGRGGILNGEKVAEAILPLRHLQSLTLVNMNPSVVPTTLTELTCLRIDHSQVRSPRTRLSQCLGIFKYLKVHSSLLQPACGHALCVCWTFEPARFQMSKTPCSCVPWYPCSCCSGRQVLFPPLFRLACSLTLVESQRSFVCVSAGVGSHRCHLLQLEPVLQGAAYPHCPHLSRYPLPSDERSTGSYNWSAFSCFRRGSVCMHCPCQPHPGLSSDHQGGTDGCIHATGYD